MKTEVLIQKSHRFGYDRANGFHMRARGHFRKDPAVTFMEVNLRKNDVRYQVTAINNHRSRRFIA